MKGLYHLYGFILVHGYFRIVAWKSDFFILQNLLKKNLRKLQTMQQSSKITALIMQKLTPLL